MRKRIVIGLLAVVVIGAGVYCALQPRAGTVEWHIEKCRSAHKAVMSPARWRIHAHTVWNIVRFAEGEGYVAKQFEEREKHQRALLKLGYLKEQEFVLSHRPIEDARDAIFALLPADPGDWEFFNYEKRGTNVLAIVATAQHMAVFSNVVRKTDVP